MIEHIIEMVRNNRGTDVELAQSIKDYIGSIPIKEFFDAI